MDRHPDWCVVICLIGEGQEINTGEAGLEAWFNALKERYPNWRIYCSHHTDYSSNTKVCIKNELHLNVSLRSFKSARLADFINNLIDNKPDEARSIYKELSKEYPILVTRNLQQAKMWVRQNARWF